MTMRKEKYCNGIVLTVDYCMLPRKQNTINNEIGLGYVIL